MSIERLIAPPISSLIGAIALRLALMSFLFRMLLSGMFCFLTFWGFQHPILS
ncbi:hypothetical protein LINPERPRIM_LOCUS21984 [Linum perenne]